MGGSERRIARVAAMSVRGDTLGRRPPSKLLFKCEGLKSGVEHQPRKNAVRCESEQRF